MKNQRKLPLIALAMASTTAVAIFLTGRIVDNIASVAPPRMAMQQQARPGSLMGRDDEAAIKRAPKNRNNNGGNPKVDPRKNQGPMGRNLGPMNGGPPPMRRPGERPPNGMQERKPRGREEMPPSMPPMPPPDAQDYYRDMPPGYPPPMQLSPEEENDLRERMMEEQERFFKNGGEPPPGYFMPPPPGYFEGDEYDYRDRNESFKGDYEEPEQPVFEDVKEDLRTGEFLEEDYYEDEEADLYESEDDYVFDEYEEDY